MTKDTKKKKDGVKTKKIPTKFPKNSFQYTIGQQGKNKCILLSSKRYYQFWINKNTKVGDTGTIEIKNKKPTRSESQLRYYAVIVGLIAENAGYSWEEAHDWLMIECWGTKTVTINSKSIEVRRSVADHSNFPKFDMQEQIDFTLKEAKKAGVIVPTKEELGYIDDSTY